MSNTNNSSTNDMTPWSWLVSLPPPFGSIAGVFLAPSAQPSAINEGPPVDQIEMEVGHTGDPTPSTHTEGTGVTDESEGAWIQFRRAVTAPISSWQDACGVICQVSWRVLAGVMSLMHPLEAGGWDLVG